MTAGFQAPNSFGGNAFGGSAFGNNFGAYPNSFGYMGAFGANKFGTNTFGAAGVAKPFYPQEIGAEFLEASAGYLAAKTAREARDKEKVLESHLKLDERAVERRPPLFVQQNQEFKSCFLDDQSSRYDSLYKLAISSRLKKSIADAPAQPDSHRIVQNTAKQQDEPRMLVYYNQYGRVALLYLVSVPPTFDLSEYVEIGHKYISLRSICECLKGIPARVTLFDVFPQGRTTSEFAQYKSKLEEHTARLGGTLISYSDETGIWEFELPELV